MSVTPGLISLVNAPQYGAANRSVPPSQVPNLIGTVGTLPGAPLWILAGTFKGILWYDKRPTGALNTGDFYYDVGRGCMLVTDGAGNWFNPISPALPRI
ncbi:MAG: hypothetical protein ACREC0_04810 [Methylocella sp.]